MSVILTSQNLFCRYEEAFDRHLITGNRSTRQINGVAQGVGGQWNLILKITGVRKKRGRRIASAYEARNVQGITVFKGCSRSAAGSAYGALPEALGEAVVRAKRYNFNQNLMLSSSKKQWWRHVQSRCSKEHLELKKKKIIYNNLKFFICLLLKKIRNTLNKIKKFICPTYKPKKKKAPKKILN